MRTSKKLKRATAVVAVAGIIVATGIVFAQSSAERPDCPGKIVCPLTGTLICRDQCPTVDPNRSDCPGRVMCPKTGKLICKDHCLLEENGTAQDVPQSRVPSCCARKG